MSAWINFIKMLITWILFDKFIQKGSQAVGWVRENLQKLTSIVRGKGSAVYKGTINPVPKIGPRTALPIRVVDRKVGGTLIVSVANKQHVLPFHKRLTTKLLSVLKSGTKVVTGKKLISVAIIASFIVFAVNTIKKQFGSGAVDIADEDLDDIERLTESEEEAAILNVEGDFEADLLDFNNDGILSHEEYLDSRTLRDSINGLSNSLINAIRLCNKYGLKLADIVEFFRGD